jgi:hypothetical protein
MKDGPRAPDETAAEIAELAAERADPAGADIAAQSPRQSLLVSL